MTERLQIYKDSLELVKMLYRAMPEKWWKYFTVSNDLKKVVLKKQFARIEITKQKIKNNRRKRNYVSRTYKQKMAAHSRV